MDADWSTERQIWRAPPNGNSGGERGALGHEQQALPLASQVISRQAFYVVRVDVRHWVRVRFAVGRRRGPGAMIVVDGRP